MVGGFEHRRRDRADLAVEPLVVERVDVGECRPLDVLDSLPWPLVIDQLGLVEVIETLGGIPLFSNAHSEVLVHVPG